MMKHDVKELQSNQHPERQHHERQVWRACKLHKCKNDLLVLKENTQVSESVNKFGP